MKLTMQQGIFLLIAFLLGGCGLFENEQIEDNPEEEIERSYTKTIERNYANEFERALIDSAEAFYQPRDSVIYILNEVYGYGNNENLIPETDYWHMNSFDGVLMPYMITKEAISYYKDLIDTLNLSNDHVFAESIFGYQADILFADEYIFKWPYFVREAIEFETGNTLPDSILYNDVYVVDMELGWRHVCVKYCQMGFIVKRIVIFDASGKLIQVYMDGPWWPVIVS